MNDADGTTVPLWCWTSGCQYRKVTVLMRNFFSLSPFLFLRTHNAFVVRLNYGFKPHFGIDQGQTWYELRLLADTISYPNDNGKPQCWQCFPVIAIFPLLLPLLLTRDVVLESRTWTPVRLESLCGDLDMDLRPVDSDFDLDLDLDLTPPDLNLKFKVFLHFWLLENSDSQSEILNRLLWKSIRADPARL